MFFSLSLLPPLACSLPPSLPRLSRKKERGSRESCLLATTKCRHAVRRSRRLFFLVGDLFPNYPPTSSSFRSACRIPFLDEAKLGSRTSSCKSPRLPVPRGRRRLSRPSKVSFFFPARDARFHVIHLYISSQLSAHYSKYRRCHILPRKRVEW